MNNDYDAIIIGAGIAGLFAGNFLAKKGVKTLICEQHSTPGGYVCGFKRNGYYFDGGAESIGSCGMLFPLLKELELFDQIKFSRCFFRFVTPDTDVSIKSLDDLQTAFGKTYPDSAAELKAFLTDLDEVVDTLGLFSGEPSFLLMSGSERIKNIVSLMRNKDNRKRLTAFRKYNQMRYPEFVASYLKNPNLRQLFSNNCYQNAALSSYAGMWYSYINDCWYPEMGLQGFSDLLAANFIKNGGTIRYRTMVKQVLLKQGRAGGVVIDGGDAINADYVIAACDYRKLFQQMLGADYLNRKRPDFKEARASQSFAMMFLGLKTGATEINKIMGADHVYYYPNYNLDLPVNDPDYFKKAGIGISSPSYHNPKFNKGEKASLVLQTYAAYDWMNYWGTGPDRLRNDEYKRLKQQVADDMLAVLEQFLPGVREEIEVMEVATPLTMERYTMNSWGSSIGWSWDPELTPSILKHNNPSLKTPVKNLYTIGHWTIMPAGVPSSAATGKLAANLIK
jgi:phytoene dehydrogenase-like protein